MAKTAKLKVFRTSIGFHDAYVAVSSRNAALEAWGADKNLFAMKAAEQVTDPLLMAEPLKHPGTVIRVAKGSTAEHLRAAGRTVALKKRPSNVRANANPEKAAPKQRPRPSRRAVDLAEQALAALDNRAAALRRDFREREEALKKERAKAEDNLTAERERLEKKLKKAKALYSQKLSEWQ